MTDRSCPSRPTPWPGRGALAATAVLALGLAARAGDPVWITLDGDFGPGSAATVEFNAQASTPTFSVVDVKIPGFWREQVLGADGLLYDRISVPGLSRIGQTGAPDLPAVRVNLAVPTDGDVLHFDSGVSDEVVFEAIRPLPTYTEGVDGSDEFDPTWDPGPGDTQGSEPEWAFDVEVYGDGADWPLQPFQVEVPFEAQLGPARGAQAVAFPMTWNPLTEQLAVHSEVTYFWVATGSPVGGGELTKLKDKTAKIHYANWSELGGLFVPNPTNYHARYLIVCEQEFWDTLEPFENHKKLRGYQVSTVAPSGGVDGIRNFIAGWYALGDPGMDHFVLLVGDVDRIPTVLMFANGTSIYSDDPYGCVGPIDESKEVSVGRLSFDVQEHLFTMLQKIMDYENHAHPDDDYEEVLLVAHEQGAPGKYVGSHTNVALGNYASNPIFYTLFGSNGPDNADVTNIINNHVGLVAYRGHGSTSTWSHWSTADDSFHKNHVVNDLSNFFHHPVVWSFSCTNSNLRFDEFGTTDSLSEVWMEASAGAVASYGASRTTSTTPNHHLNETLFDIVYDLGVTTHGHALELAEASVWSQWPGHHNPYAYMLLGDPSMTIRRGGSQILSLDLPGEIFLDEQPGNLFAQLFSTGDLLEDGLVSIYKESFLSGYGAELEGAFWVDEDDEVQLPVPLSTPGTLHVTARDASGNVLQQTIDVKMGLHWTDLGHGLGGDDPAPRLAGTGSLWAGNPWSLLLAGAAPGSTVWLCLGFGELNLPFKGGVMVPDLNAPGLAVPLLTDEAGNIPISAVWPANVPSGSTLVFQYWAQDPSGPVGFVSSNAVRADVP